MEPKTVKGQTSLELGLTESYKFLTKELMSLGLNIELLEEKSQEDVYIYKW